MLLFATFFLFPFALHPPIGLVLQKLIEGKRKRAFLVALFAGLFYDLSINHLPFGVLTFFWLLATGCVEGVRRLFFLGEIKELLIGTLLFSFFLQGSQALYLNTPSALFSYQQPLEVVGAATLFWAVPALRKYLHLRRLRLVQAR